MSWMIKLAELYDRNESQVGTVTEKSEPLIPIFHKTQNAHIKITLTENGDFVSAESIGKTPVIVPCSESAACRSGAGAIPMALEDNLQYMAGDLDDWTGKNYQMFFESYIAALQKWAESGFSHKKIKAVFNYVSKRSVIKDLVASGVLAAENGKLLPKADLPAYKENPDIIKAFVCFSVVGAASEISECYLDKTLFKAWINYYESLSGNKGVCYATGRETMLAGGFPKFIRNSGDGAKIISGNDNSNFTYRGVFDKAEQVCGLGAEITQKAHLALKWLIGRQGFKSGELVFLTWNNSDIDAIPRVDKDYCDAGAELDGFMTSSQTESAPDTAQEYAVNVRKTLAGYKKLLEKTEPVIVMGLNSATPGRLSIIYYREIMVDDFFNRVENWYDTCSWLISRYYKKSGETKGVWKTGVRTPTPKEIIYAAYGPLERVDDKLTQKTIERIVYCIIDGKQIPWDIVVSAVNRVAKPDSFDSEFEWERALTITCAMVRKFINKEEYTMALNTEINDRDYLFGRLLAIADNIESWANSKNNESRETAAMRYFSRFAAMPASTWKTIELALKPSISRLDGAYSRMSDIGEILDKIDIAEFDDKPLSAKFLLGFHNQKQYYRNKNKNEKGE